MALKMKTLDGNEAAASVAYRLPVNCFSASDGLRSYQDRSTVLLLRWVEYILLRMC